MRVCRHERCILDANGYEGRHVDELCYGHAKHALGLLELKPSADRRQAARSTSKVDDTWIPQLIRSSRKHQRTGGAA